MNAKVSRSITVLTALVVAAAISRPSARGADDAKSMAQETVQTFIQKDASLKPVLDRAAGYAVFPSVGEGGFIVGGAHGNGVVYEKGKPIGEAKVTKATIGAQAGAQSFSELIVFETPETLRQFKSSNFEISADLTAVVAAEGSAQSANYQQGVAIFTLPKKGVMAKAAIGGQKFKFEPYQ